MLFCLVKHQIDHSLQVIHEYFLDCNHAMIFEIMTRVHSTEAATTKQRADASLVNVIIVLTHTNT